MKTSRLTQKTPKVLFPRTGGMVYCYAYNTTEKDKCDVAIKLGQLEDIEEELGIDLITLIKALNGIYYRFNQKDDICQMKVPMLRIINKEYCWICPKWMTTTWMNVKLKDYGKTWALTKEKLE